MSSEQYQNALIQLAESNDVRVQALYAEHLAGRIPLERLLDLVTELLVVGNSRATLMAASGLWTQLARALGRAPKMVVLKPSPVSVSRERVRSSVKQIVETVPDYVAAIEDEPARETARRGSVAERLSRMAVDEPIETSTRATQEGITRYTVEHNMPIKGWRRRLDPDPCKICRNWAGNGRVYKASTRFWRHSSDKCVPEIVMAPP